MQILDSLVEGALLLEDEREANELIGMMMRYLATGEMPEGRTAAQRMSLMQVMPVLENSRARSEAGSRGGRKSAGSRQGEKQTGKQSAKQTAKQTGKQSAKQNAKQTAKQTSSKPASEEEEEERDKPLTGFRESAPAFSVVAEPGFTPPSADEVRAYFAANCLTGDPDAFVDHYAALGWKQNGRDVYDWRPLARQWHRRQRGFDAEARARGQMGAAEQAASAVWRPAESEEDELARIDAQLAALGGAL